MERITEKQRGAYKTTGLSRAASRLLHRRTTQNANWRTFHGINALKTAPNGALHNQNSPTIFPSSFTSIAFADGTFGKPGIVITSPQTSTINSAPAASRTSRIVTT